MAEGLLSHHPNSGLICRVHSLKHSSVLYNQLNLNLTGYLITYLFPCIFFERHLFYSNLGLELLKNTKITWSLTLIVSHKSEAIGR